MKLATRCCQTSKKDSMSSTAPECRGTPSKSPRQSVPKLKTTSTNSTLKALFQISTSGLIETDRMSRKRAVVQGPSKRKIWLWSQTLWLKGMHKGHTMKSKGPRTYFSANQIFTWVDQRSCLPMLKRTRSQLGQYRKVIGKNQLRKPNLLTSQSFCQAQGRPLQGLGMLS